MVEMNLPDRSRVTEWHAWYTSHIRKLLTVDGYNGAQRFEALTPSASPFLAIHDVDDAGVFESVQYRSVGGPSGTGEWQHLMTNWHRNLLSGCEAMPPVESDQTLVIIDEGASVPDPLATQVMWLDAVGLDRSIQRRGALVSGSGEDLASLSDRVGVHRFAPITAKMR
jgi:hypothetical protein